MLGTMVHIEFIYPLRSFWFAFFVVNCLNFIFYKLYFNTYVLHMTYMYFLTLYFPLSYMASCVDEFLIFQLYTVRQKLKTLMKKYMMQYLHDACAALFSRVTIPQYAAADCEHSCSCSPCCDGEAVAGFVVIFLTSPSDLDAVHSMMLWICSAVLSLVLLEMMPVLWRMCRKHTVATGQCSVSKSITATTTACRQRYNHEQQPCHSHIFNNQSHQHWQLCHSSVCSRNARFSFLAVRQDVTLTFFIREVHLQHITNLIKFSFLKEQEKPQTK